jgi:hypothetical protein
MGPLIPVLLLVPVLVGAAWLFRDNRLVATIFGLGAIGVIIEYCRQYSRFAKNDPDRLQSEQFRFEMKKIHMIAAKELPYPIPATSLHLPEAISNPAHPLPDISDIHDSLVPTEQVETERKG